MTIRISRRALLAGLCAPAILSLPRGAIAATTLTLGHNAAAGNPRQIAAEKFAELVKERSGGRISVRVAGAEQLGNEQSLLTGLRTGAIDFTTNSQGSASAFVPEVAALGLPYLFADTETAFKVLDGPIGAKLGERFASVGMVSFGWWDNGIRHVINSKRPIKVPADLKGLKIRTPPDPSTIDTFEALGAATEQISFGEVYIAIQQGVVDGLENALANIASSKFYEVSKFISLTGHKWESSPLLGSQITWTRLGKDVDIILEAAAEATVLQRTLMAEQDRMYLDQFTSDPNLSVNEVERQQFAELVTPVTDEWRKKPFGGFVDELVAAAKG